MTGMLAGGVFWFVWSEIHQRVLGKRVSRTSKSSRGIAGSDAGLLWMCVMVPVRVAGSRCPCA